VGKNIDSGSTLASVQDAPRKVATGIGLRTIDHLGLRVGLMDGWDERLQQAAVISGLVRRIRIPVADVFLVPQGIIVNAPAKVPHRPPDVIRERFDLLRRGGRPEYRIEAAVVVVETARLGRDL